MSQKGVSRTCYFYLPEQPIDTAADCTLLNSCLLSCSKESGGSKETLCSILLLDWLHLFFYPKIQFQKKCEFQTVCGSALGCTAVKGSWK